MKQFDHFFKAKEMFHTCSLLEQRKDPVLRDLMILRNSGDNSNMSRLFSSSAWAIDECRWVRRWKCHGAPLAR